MLVPKYKDMDGEIIVVVLQQESFFFFQNMEENFFFFNKKKKKREENGRCLTCDKSGQQLKGQSTRCKYFEFSKKRKQ